MWHYRMHCLIPKWNLKLKLPPPTNSSMRLLHWPKSVVSLIAIDFRSMVLASHIWRSFVHYFRTKVDMRRRYQSITSLYSVVPNWAWLILIKLLPWVSLAGLRKRNRWVCALSRYLKDMRKWNEKWSFWTFASIYQFSAESCSIQCYIYKFNMH